MLKILENYQGVTLIAKFATHQEISPTLDSIYKSSVLDKKRRKRHFCDAPLNFENFDLKL